MDRVLRSLPCVKFLCDPCVNICRMGIAQLCEHSTITRGMQDLQERFIFFLKRKMSQGGVVLILPSFWRRCFTMQSAGRVCEIANYFTVL